LDTDLNLLWGPYKGYTALAPADGYEAAWGPLFATLDPELPGGRPGNELLTHMRLVESARSHPAPVRKPQAGFPDKTRRMRPAKSWQPFRLVNDPTVEDRVVAKKGTYSVIFQAHSPAALLKLVELNDAGTAGTAQTGDLLKKSSLTALVRDEVAERDLQSILCGAGLTVEWDKGLIGYLRNKRRHLDRQQASFENVPAEHKDKYRSFSAMSRKLRQKLAPDPVDRVPPALRTQYLLNRKRLEELDLADKLNPMQAHDTALLACKQRAIAAHEQGLGKTRICLAAAALAGSKSVLVVCYSRLIEVWKHELEELGLGDQVQIVERREDLASRKRFHLISYERLGQVVTYQSDRRCPHCESEVAIADKRCPTCRRELHEQRGCPSCGAFQKDSLTYCPLCGYAARTYKPPLYRRMKRRYSLVIFDESQAAKSRDAQRSRACQALRPRRTLLATGTMLENYVSEAYWQLFLLFRGSCVLPYPFLGGQKRFLEQFATYDDSQGRRRIVPGVKSVDKWHGMMDWIMLRRSWSDPEVSSHLSIPPANLETVWLLPTEAEAHLYEEMQSRFREWYDQKLEEERRALEVRGYARVAEQLTPVEILSQLTTLRRVASQPWSFPWYKGDMDTCKLVAVDRIVKGAARNGEKVIIASWQKEVVEVLGKRLSRYGCGVIRGDVPIAERNRLIDAFQKEDTPRVLAVTTGSAGLGITLTRATTVVLLDLEWSPAAMAQMWRRAHRIGQTRELKVVFLLANLPLERKMNDLLAQKGEAIALAMRDEKADIATSAVDWRDFAQELISLGRPGWRTRLLEVGDGEGVSLGVGSRAQLPWGRSSVVHWGARLLEIDQTEDCEVRKEEPVHVRELLPGEQPPLPLFAQAWG